MATHLLFFEQASSLALLEVLDLLDWSALFFRHGCWKSPSTAKDAKRKWRKSYRILMVSSRFFGCFCCFICISPQISLFLVFVHLGLVFFLHFQALMSQSFVLFFTWFLFVSPAISLLIPSQLPLFWAIFSLNLILLRSFFLGLLHFPPSLLFSFEFPQIPFHFQLYFSSYLTVLIISVPWVCFISLQSHSLVLSFILSSISAQISHFPTFSSGSCSVSFDFLANFTDVLLFHFQVFTPQKLTPGNKKYVSPATWT